MSVHRVSVFKPYNFARGQKIRIESGPRAGDWEVIDLTKRKVTLQCPLSKRIFQWTRFCYHAQERDQAWPLED